MDPPQASTETTHDVVEEESSAMVGGATNNSTSLETTTGGCVREERGPSYLPIMSIPSPLQQAQLGLPSSITVSEATASSKDVTVTDQVS